MKITIKPSEYTFPFEGNWNHGSLANVIRDFNCILWIHFPVWRELKQNLLCAFVNYVYTLNTLSRLKGIETFILPFYMEDFTFDSEYTFPFEGNWNSSSSGRYSSNGRYSTLNTLSRLKGIETSRLGLLCSSFSLLWIHFPVWRELKLSSSSGCGFRVYALNTLSRLKGIETWRSLAEVARWSSLNTLSRLKGIETCWCGCSSFGCWLWIHFPVWRELKRDFLGVGDVPNSTLNTLSRLKGIETFWLKC